MSLPILAYGQPILKSRAANTEPGYPALALLIGDMWDTLKEAEGCGLAAPQVGHAIRLFVIDSRPAYFEMEPESRLVYFDGDTGLSGVFINPTIIDTSARTWIRTEACLSLPGIQGEIVRHWSITLQYLDEHFKPHTRQISGMSARIIQHEYDHINGVLFTDRLSAFKRKWLHYRLRKIAKGKVKATYRLQRPSA